MTTRVVLADDVADIRRMPRAVFNFDDRFEVVGEATTGREALRVIDLTHPDVVLLDIFMPELDGLEVAAHIAEQSPATKVVFLSALGREAHPDADWMADATYLQKGVSVRVILDTVAEAARRPG